MLDEAIEYLKMLQLQLQVCRLNLCAILDYYILSLLKFMTSLGYNSWQALVFECCRQHSSKTCCRIGSSHLSLQSVMGGCCGCFPTDDVNEKWDESPTNGDATGHSTSDADVADVTDDWHSPNGYGDDGDAGDDWHEHDGSWSTSSRATCCTNAISWRPITWWQCIEFIESYWWSWPPLAHLKCNGDHKCLSSSSASVNANAIGKFRLRIGWTKDLVLNVWIWVWLLWSLQSSSRPH